MTTQSITRETRTGLVRGVGHPTYSVFYSVPYAAAPGVGAGRFDGPVPHEPWSGVRDATRPGPNAPQLPRGVLGPLDASAYFVPGWIAGPDYLTVNVWTPPAVFEFPPRQAPVLVFVHGGAFVAGSSHSPLMDGRHFAEQGIVTVTVNYRLGLAGFLDLPDAPPNRGLADVLAALRWVKDNIATFGGDPANVTLGGHSAGAMLTAAAIASPETGGLFQRAIMQSGSGTADFTREQAAIVTEKAAKILGVPATRAGFADRTDRELLEVAQQLMGTDLGTSGARDPLQRIAPFGVVSDEQPAATVARGRGQNVDLLIGHNAEEGNLYLLPSGEFDATTAADLAEAAAYAHPDPDRLLSVYTAAHPGAGHGELRSLILGEAAFGAGSRALADAHAAAGGRPTFAYDFRWRSPALAGRLGAAHIVEVPFAFATITSDLLADHLLLGAGPAPRALARAVHSAWCRFVATGSPGWRMYDLVDRATMTTVGEELTVVDDPYAAVRAAWA
jgi:para-nitrobenzyl esterase